MQWVVFLHEACKSPLSVLFHQDEVASALFDRNSVRMNSLQVDPSTRVEMRAYGPKLCD
jgi:hypothetical protein